MQSQQATLDQILNQLSQEDILSILPKSNKTAEAYLCRLCAYAPLIGNNKQALLDLIINYRHHDDWQKKAGHARQVMMLHIAIVVKAAMRKNTRNITPAMQAMDSAFPNELCNNYLKIFMLERDFKMSWSKDGGTTFINVPQCFKDNANIIEWAGVQWADQQTN